MPSATAAASAAIAVTASLFRLASSFLAAAVTGAATLVVLVVPAVVMAWNDRIAVLGLVNFGPEAVVPGAVHMLLDLLVMGKVLPIGVHAVRVALEKDIAADDFSVASPANPTLRLSVGQSLEQGK